VLVQRIFRNRIDCDSRKLITHPITPSTVRIDDAGHRSSDQSTTLPARLRTKPGRASTMILTPRALQFYAAELQVAWGYAH
jgi:hypothetical protein